MIYAKPIQTPFIYFKQKYNILAPKYLRLSSQLLAAAQFTPFFSLSSRLKGHG